MPWQIYIHPKDWWWTWTTLWSSTRSGRCLQLNMLCMTLQPCNRIGIFRANRQNNSWASWFFGCLKLKGIIWTENDNKEPDINRNTIGAPKLHINWLLWKLIKDLTCAIHSSTHAYVTHLRLFTCFHQCPSVRSIWGIWEVRPSRVNWMINDARTERSFTFRPRSSLHWGGVIAFLLQPSSFVVCAL